MRLFCLSILPLLILLLAFCILVVWRWKQDYYKSLCALLGCTLTTMLFYFFYLANGENIAIAHVFKNLYFISMAWQILLFFQFLRKFFQLPEYVRVIDGIFQIGVLVETVCYLVNIWKEQVFHLVKVYNSTNHSSFYLTTYKTQNFFLMAFSYVILAAILMLLIIKYLHTSKYYRNMYSELFVQVCLLITINLLGVIQHVYVDFTVPFYGLVAITVSYFSLYATPKKMIMDMAFNVVRDMNSCIFCMDRNCRCIYMNKMALELFGVDEKVFAEEAEKRCRDWIEHKGDQLENRAIWRTDVMVQNVQKSFEIEFMKLVDEKQRCVGYFYCMNDITQLLADRIQEQYRATHDELTGVYSRDAFFAKAEEIIRSNKSKKRYMICTDIKNFKLVNDLFGEELGDQVLIDQARMLQKADYPECIHGRLSGDRFAMLICQENFNPELAARNTSTLQYLVDENNYKIPIMIGVYDIKDPDESAKVMCDKATMAISTIVEDYGGKLFAYYEDDMMKKLIKEKWVTSDFDRALKAGEFMMLLQPQTDANKDLVGAEALVRWNHAEYGMIAPDDFIPVVEKSGYIYKLDRFIWEEAVKRLSVWKEKGWTQLTISVNICPKDFYYADLYKEFTSLVERYEVSPANLNLEITESVLMRDVEEHMEVLTKLAEYGFQVEIDDFGSGFSSLNQLKNMPVDILKMDMGFLQDEKNYARSNTIMASVISMAKALQMQVVMEGIENEGQMKMLALMGCDLFQGFFISRPITVQEFEDKFMETTLRKTVL